MPKVPKSVRLKWPVGPHYSQWVEGKGVHAWARFKIKSSDWYCHALEVATREAGDLDRYVGIEMALDGALTSLCGAVEAVGSSLLEALTRGVDDPDSDHETLVVEDWVSVYALARTLGIALPSEVAVSEALTGIESRSPGGWLAQLRQLRDEAVRHNILARHFKVGDDRGRFIDVPGLGACQPIEYLASARMKTAKLVEVLLVDLDGLPKLLEPKEHARRVENRPLPDLMKRAGVVEQSHDRGPRQPFVDDHSRSELQSGDSELGGPVCPNCQQPLRENLINEYVSEAAIAGASHPVLLTYCGSCRFTLNIIPAGSQSIAPSEYKDVG